MRESVRGKHGALHRGLVGDRFAASRGVRPLPRPGREEPQLTPPPPGSRRSRSARSRGSGAGSGSPGSAAAHAHRAVAPPLRAATRMDPGNRVRGRDRRLQSAARPSLHSTGDLVRVAAAAARRGAGRRSLVHHPGPGDHPGALRSFPRRASTAGRARCRGGSRGVHVPVAVAANAPPGRWTNCMAPPLAGNCGAGDGSAGSACPDAERCGDGIARPAIRIAVAAISARAAATRVTRRVLAALRFSFALGSPFATAAAARDNGDAALRASMRAVPRGTAVSVGRDSRCRSDRSDRWP